MAHTKRMTQDELIRACCAGEPLAQRMLYERYKDAMFTLAYRIAGDFELAEEILHDAFLKIFRAIGGFRGESTLGAWIKVIVIRTAYARVRKKVVFQPLEYDVHDEAVQLSTDLDIEYLERAIMSLPEGYRTVFTMVEIEGLSHKEVAEVLGISEGTSKSQLFYAKRKLRELLKQ